MTRQSKPWGRALLPALSLCLAVNTLCLVSSVQAGGPQGESPEPATPADAWLDVLDAEQQRIATLAMPSGAGWCMVWNHSVEGFPVHDCYRNRDGRMVLERSHQPDYAAGLGPVLGRGKPRSDGAGGYWIEDIDEPVIGNRYLLRVGSPKVNHRLVNGETLISLSELAAGERVEIHLRTEK